MRLGNNGGIGGTGIFGFFGTTVICNNNDTSFYCIFTKYLHLFFMILFLCYILYILYFYVFGGKRRR